MICSKCGENNVYINNRHIICRNCGHRKYLQNLYIHESEYKKEQILWKLINRWGYRGENREVSSADGIKIAKSRNVNGFITYPEYEYIFKIILFGDSGVNRTGLTQKGVRNVSDSESGMSIGVEWGKKTLKVDDQIVKLDIWDVGGEERYRSMVPYYARGASGGLFVCDMSNYSSLTHIDDWLTAIWKEIKVNDRFPVVVVGLVPDDENKREVSTEEAKKIAKSRNVNGFIETSSKTGENVEKAFEALTRLMLDASELPDQKIKSTLEKSQIIKKLDLYIERPHYLSRYIKKILKSKWSSEKKDQWANVIKEILEDWKAVKPKKWKLASKILLRTFGSILVSETMVSLLSEGITNLYNWIKQNLEK